MYIWWGIVIQKGLCVYETHVNEMKFNYIPVLNVLLITDSLGLHKIILKKTSSKGA